MTLHVGDTAPRFTATLTSGAAPVDLTGANVEVHLRKPDRSTVATLTATGDAEGHVTADAWGDLLDTAGTWQAEVQVTYSDGTVQTFGAEAFTVAAQLT